MGLDLDTVLSRRKMLIGGAALAASARGVQADSLYGDNYAPLQNPDLFPPKESAIDFPIPETDLSTIPEQFRRQAVAFEGAEVAGTIVVDPPQHYLYHVQDDGTAVRYGVGVGRKGFEWSGEATVGMKRRWPRWLPPAEMTFRDERAAKWLNGMPGGPDNPLGARALYLFNEKGDTQYRIHGTNEPLSIGKSMSSGCIRMLNQDVAELFERVPIGTRVVVLGDSYM